jgi:trimeric autotransporter adhesin
MNKTKLMKLIVPVAIAVLAGACAQPPTTIVDGAKAALEAAKAAEAGDYAAGALAEAQTAQAALEAELKAQEGKFALTRSYTKTAELAAAAKAAADKAVADAAAGKEAMKSEVAGSIETVKASVAAVKDLLAKAPKGKGSAADIETMTTDLAGIEASFADADSAFAAGKYQDAKAKLAAAQQGADKIKADIDAAIAAKSAATRKK